jgi:hypothetical protein
MNIFISYSTHDLATVKQLADELTKYGQVFYWDLSKVPGQESWPTIFEWIDYADIVFVVITGNTVQRAMSVGQEVGHAKAKDRYIVPLVSREVPSSELGFLSGITYQPIDVWNPKPAIDAAAALAASRKDTIETGRLAIAVIAIGFLAWLFAKME